MWLSDLALTHKTDTNRHPINFTNSCYFKVFSHAYSAIFPCIKIQLNIIPNHIKCNKWAELSK